MASKAFDLTGGTTSTTGTGIYDVASDAFGLARFDTIPDGTQIDATVRRGDQYEVVTGVVGGSGTTLTRDTVRGSSNGGALVDWGTGIKDVYTTFSAKSIEELQDFQDASSLPVGVSPDGTEKLIALQTGSSRTLTSEQLAGDIADTVMGMGRDKIRIFTRFTGAHTSLSLVGTTSGAIQPIVGVPGLHAVIDHNATTSTVTFNPTFAPGSAKLGTNSGWAAIAASAGGTIAWTTDKDIDFRAAVGLTTLPNTSGQTHESYFGVMQRPEDALGAVPAFGAWFQATSSSLYWECVVDDNVSAPFKVTTDVLVTQQSGFFPNIDALRVFHNGTDNQTEFYFNGALVATITDAERPWPTFAPPSVIYVPTAYLRRVSGSTGKSVVVSSFRFDIDASLANGKWM